ncbi:hypothetical protein OOZ19_22555 [Saccharopolyspora sp. NFXS83]|uniref:hypothetical protein n=1 Tax=Saccharopolyspora sp. NFXS83 TaxID=2993560 RepID=UPI00224AE8EF|nr:hypothetical protein [Saccharopolyspora sp. NFXS83]MCX2733031.1 hypothetical protein [Saccharopolyspora sp. NFXS83]
MRALLTACGNVVRDFAYGIDAGHAIKHGAAPAPQPALRVASRRRAEAPIRTRVHRPVSARLEVAG